MRRAITHPKGRAMLCARRSEPAGRLPSDFSYHPTCPEVVARLGGLTSMLQRYSGPPRLLQRGKMGTQEPCAAATSSDTSSSSPLPLPLTSHWLLYNLEYPSTRCPK